ncbi:MAG TPA: xanthine dehydrogenase family protein molybdopterin-binding subunit, partial [Dehalococcoidia bacterium]|nr:xanthine dehydrogenase family protein molybdopterin-binding subunit [Dehalococcoidia bacterium]
MANLTTVGVAAERVEGRAKVTGQATYAADVILPGMLWGKLLRSPYPHARIRSIDTSKAKALPGVHTVLTAADLPDIRIGRYIMDIPLLASDVVRFIGEKVVAIAAESPEIAEEAMRLIEIDYEELPAVFDANEAMQPNAPVIHDEPSSYGVAPSPAPVHGDLKIGPHTPNVVASVTYRHGDLEGAFARADHVFEHTFSAIPVHQGYMEPHACMVSAGEDGKIDFWYSHKQPFVARSQMAQALGVPEEQIRINPMFIGGDFGGKGSLMDGLICYFLAERSGKPVKMIMSYTEELMAGNPRHDALVTLRTAVSNDGRILARHGTMVFNTGAYAGFTPAPVLHGAFEVGGAYRMDAIGIDVLRVYTNTVPRGHMRSPGTPQVMFAVECHTDMIARELGIDPLEFRLRNAVVAGEPGPLGEEWSNVRCRETLEAAGEAINWGAPRPKNVGKGIAVYGREPGNFGPSSSTLELHANGSLRLITGGAETGTGFFTVMQQLVAEE